jgi:hypothetical protein
MGVMGWRPERMDYCGLLAENSWAQLLSLLTQLDLALLDCN